MFKMSFGPMNFDATFFADCLLIRQIVAEYKFGFNK